MFSLCSCCKQSINKYESLDETCLDETSLEDFKTVNDNDETRLNVYLIRLEILDEK